MVGNALHATSTMSYNEGPQRPNGQVTSSLATWLWLWETNDGPRWARELGDAWLLPLLSKVLFRRTSSVDKVWTLDMELAHPQTDTTRLQEVMAKYRAKAQTPWPAAGLDLGHLPALLMLEARPGHRAPAAGSCLALRTSDFPERVQEDPLWELINNNDQVLLNWWLDDSSFTPERVNSYRVGYDAKDVLSHRLDDAAWAALWLRHGASPAGAPELSPGDRPLFRASPEVARLLLAAGEDPDSLDEQGRLPDEMRRRHGQVVLGTHPVFQAARQALGRTASVADAHFRHQFAKLVLNPATLPTPLDKDFQAALKRGPLPRWKSGAFDLGLAEWIARTACEHYEGMAAPLLDLARRQQKLRASLDQIGSSQVPDWAVAHVLTAGVDHKFKAKPGEAGLAASLLPLQSSEALGHLLRAWTLHGGPTDTRGARLTKAWPLTPAWAASLTPEHGPDVHALVQSCLPEGEPPSGRWSLMGAQHLAAAAWRLAQDPEHQLDLWAVTVMSPSVDEGAWTGKPGTPVWRSAVEQAPNGFWEKLPHTRAWCVLRSGIEQKADLWSEVQAKVRDAQAQHVAPPSPRRPRARA